jgi:hypothetical protein
MRLDTNCSPRSYGVLKQKLFCDRLPDCMITLQHDRHAYGHFVGDKYGTRDGREITDEIALNPSRFRGRTTEQILSTLAHEMMPDRGPVYGVQYGALISNMECIPHCTP